MKILVTGAKGFTGGHFIAQAKLKGHDIHALSANLNDSSALNAEVLSCAPDAVVHLAAISFVGHTDLSAFYQVNVIGTLNLLDALLGLQKKPQKVLLASSANIYGNAENSPITELHTPAPVNHYAASKLAMEHLSRTYVDRLPLFFTRPFNYIGPGQAESFVIPKIIKHFVNRAESLGLGNLDVAREFNDVRFVCDAYLNLIEKAEIGEAYNICTNQPYTLKDVINLISKITSHNLNVKVNPAFVRKNEVYKLCGDNTKLNTLTPNLPQYLLYETLQWIVSNYNNV